MRNANLSKRTLKRTSARRGVASALAVALLALGATVAARPAPIPPPPGLEPEMGESPATGQPAPSDPEVPPEIPEPQGMACVEGQDQSICDPNHPGGPQGQMPGNEPGDAWFQDMAMQMYGMQQALQDMAAWSQGQASTIHYFSEWLLSVTRQYYAMGYTPSGQPRMYPFGRMTRGDFNYIMYYWIKPLYFNLLYQGAQFYTAHASMAELAPYKQKLYQVAVSYHRLMACNYGLNGADKGARQDMEARESELAAGMRPPPM